MSNTDRVFKAILHELLINAMEQEQEEEEFDYMSEISMAFAKLGSSNTATYYEDAFQILINSLDHTVWESFIETFIYRELGNQFSDDIFEIKVTAYDNGEEGDYEQGVIVNVIGDIALHETVKCALIALDKCIELDVLDLDEM